MTTQQSFYPTFRYRADPQGNVWSFGAYRPGPKP